MKKLIPNILSVSRIPLGIFFFLTFLNDKTNPLLPLAILLISMMTDFFDGFLARKMNIVSEHGKWLDPISDFLFYFIVYLSFFMKGVMPLFFYILFLTRESIMYALIRPLYVKKRLEVSAKLPGKIKTAFNGVGVLIIILLSIGWKWGIIEVEIFNICALVIFTIVIPYSFVSLYWYIKVFFVKNNGETT